MSAGRAWAGPPLPGRFGPLRAVSGGRGRAGAVWESGPRDLPAIVAPGICPRSRGALRSWPLDTAAGMAKEDNECNVVPERIDRPLSAAFDNGEGSGVTLTLARAYVSVFPR